VWFALRQLFLCHVDGGKDTCSGQNKSSREKRVVCGLDICYDQFSVCHRVCVTVFATGVCVTVFATGVCVTVFATGVCVTVFATGVCVTVFATGVCVAVFATGCVSQCLPRFTTV